MTDLTSLMTRATRTVGSTSPATLDADLLRGRTALKRRHRTAGALVGTAATAAVVMALITGTTPTGEVGSRSIAVGQMAPVELVRYVSTQPTGFVIDRVPEHWKVLQSDTSDIVLGAASDSGENAAGREPNLTERIVIQLQAQQSVPTDLPSRSIQLTSTRKATVYRLLGVDEKPDGTLGVFAPESDGRTLSVQIPPRLHWTDTQIARFVRGLHITDSATTTAG